MSTSKRDQLAELKDAYLLCRTSERRHPWEDFVPLKGEHYFSIEPTVCLRCTRCGTEKYLWVDAAGNYTYQPQYIYPPGYTLAGVHRGDRLTAAELRIEVVKRLKGGGRGRGAATKRHLKAV